MLVNVTNNKDKTIVLNYNILKEFVKKAPRDIDDEGLYHLYYNIESDDISIVRKDNYTPIKKIDPNYLIVIKDLNTLIKFANLKTIINDNNL